MTVFFWCEACAARGVLGEGIGVLGLKAWQGNGCGVWLSWTSRAVAGVSLWHGFGRFFGGLTRVRVGVRMEKWWLAARSNLENCIDKRFQPPAVAILVNPF